MIHIVLEVHLVPVGLPNASMLALEMAFSNLETEEWKHLTVFMLLSKIFLENREIIEFWKSELIFLLRTENKAS